MKQLSFSAVLYCSIIMSAAVLADETIDHQGVQIQVRGQGQDLVFIPGLNSSADAFDEICKAVLATHRCHQVQLPGFAGLAPVEMENGEFLSPMAARLQDYLTTRGIEKPIIVGHSLGGVLAMKIALEQPALPEALIIIDSLPYYPAAQNPMASAEQMEPMARQMKTSMTSASQEEYERRIPMNLMGMTRDQSRLPTLVEWGETTDKDTSAQAIYDMMTTDLRGRVHEIQVPVLIAGSWAAYEPMGSTKDMTLAVFENQYRGLENKRITLSERGFHFLMWDDREWLLENMTAFLAEL